MQPTECTYNMEYSWYLHNDTSVMTKSYISTSWVCRWIHIFIQEQLLQTRTPSTKQDMCMKLAFHGHSLISKFCMNAGKPQLFQCLC